MSSNFSRSSRGPMYTPSGKGKQELPNHSARKGLLDGLLLSEECLRVPAFH